MGQKLPDPGDRRVQRTRRALREAMVGLIHERGWEGFTVQDVCDRADVGRSTFYMHHADKEELLAASLADLRDGLRALAAAGPGGPLSFVRGLLAHAYEEKRLFLAVAGKKSGLLVLRGFREVVLDLVREDLAPLAAAGPRRDAVAAFLAGALIEFVTFCLEAKAPPSLDEAEALFADLARPVLALAPARGSGRGGRGGP